MAKNKKPRKKYSLRPTKLNSIPSNAIEKNIAFIIDCELVAQVTLPRGLITFYQQGKLLSFLCWGVITVSQDSSILEEKSAEESLKLACQAIHCLRTVLQRHPENLVTDLTVKPEEADIIQSAVDTLAPYLKSQLSEAPRRTIKQLIAGFDLSQELMKNPEKEFCGISHEETLRRISNVTELAKNELLKRKQ